VVGRYPERPFGVEGHGVGPDPLGAFGNRRHGPGLGVDALNPVERDVGDVNAAITADGDAIRSTADPDRTVDMPRDVFVAKLAITQVPGFDTVDRIAPW
jgi:hypothetical protein